jgi:16S rRNA processing protein RimM
VGQRPEGSENLTSKEAGPFLAIGRIVKTQGRRGEILAEVLTDFPARFQGLRKAFLGTGSLPPRPAEVENTWPHKGRMVVKFLGVDSITEAERLVGLHILIPQEERMQLPSHHYYVWELKGCRVVREHQGVREEVGTVTEVESTGGVDLLHVSRPGGGGGEVLIPLAQAICTRIDPEAKTIVIDPPADLLELNL